MMGAERNISRLCANEQIPCNVMLGGAKHLAFSCSDEDEILRLCLRMTIRCGLSRRLS